MHRIPDRNIGAFGPAALITLLVLLFGLAACGSDGDDSAERDETTETVETTDDTTADEDDGADDDEPAEEQSDGDEPAEEPSEDDEPAEEPSDDDEPVDEGDATEESDDGAPVSSGDVSMVEWALEAPTTYQAGEVSFVAANGGSFPHELAIARGDGYDTLPQTLTGAVDEAELGADFLGRTERISPGAEATLTLDLEPGNYVIFCNLGSGPSSHAANGQVLSITVEG